MDDNGKYIRLFGMLFFSFVGFIVALVLIMLGLRLFFGVLSYVPWFNNLYILFIVCVPAILFITVYLIYYKRTKQLSSMGVKVFSYIVFFAALAAWAIFWVLDLIKFFKYNYNAISDYYTFNLAFLASNVLAIFLVGIVQAFNSKKEISWIERNQLNKN